jgi:hypothetical protein
MLHSLDTDNVKIEMKKRTGKPTIILSYDIFFFNFCILFWVIINPETLKNVNTFHWGVVNIVFPGTVVYNEKNWLGQRNILFYFLPFFCASSYGLLPILASPCMAGVKKMYL